MTEPRKDAPTLVEVEQLTTRLEALEAKETAVAIKEAGLATQITDAHLEGLDEKSLSTLMWERRELHNECEEIAAAVPLLRARIVEQREDACLGEASKRMRGIGKAFGSLRSEIAEDVVRVQEKAKAYAEEVERLNNRYNALMRLKLEANALSDRFAVEAPTFQPVAIPSLQEGCKRAASIVQAPFIFMHYRSPKTEKCSHGLRARRTFQEVNGTPTGLIIEAAGLKAFPALTAKQEEIVEAREREKVTEATAAARAAGMLEAAASPVRHGL